MAALEELLVDQLKDLLHAEGQGVKAFPKLIRAAHHPKLKAALQKHSEESKGQVERLKTVFELLGEKAKAKPCKGMQGITEEAQEEIEEGKSKSHNIADLILVAAAQRVEHYEIAGYGTARTIAEKLGNAKVVRLLSQTLAEEERSDKLLTTLSVPLLKAASLESDDEDSEE
jgi:Mn-containing catalase